MGRLAPLTLAVDEAAVTVEVSGAFRDPDGDALTYGARILVADDVAAVTVSGSVVTVIAGIGGDVDGDGDGDRRRRFEHAGDAEFHGDGDGAPANRPPEPLGRLAPLTLAVDEAAVTVRRVGRRSVTRTVMR